MTDFPPSADRRAELTRIGFSGTVWFAAALLATVLPLTGLFAAGWRPAQLPEPAVPVWWAGSGLSLAGLGALAWAGCPVLGRDPDRSDVNKSQAVRIGVVLHVLGLTVACVTVMIT